MALRLVLSTSRPPVRCCLTDRLWTNNHSRHPTVVLLSHRRGSCAAHLTRACERRSRYRPCLRHWSLEDARSRHTHPHDPEHARRAGKLRRSRAALMRGGTAQGCGGAGGSLHGRLRAPPPARDSAKRVARASGIAFLCLGSRSRARNDARTARECDSRSNGIVNRMFPRTCRR